MRLHNVLLLQNTNCVGNVTKEDTIRLRTISHQELRNHAKAVAVRHTRSKIARQHCVRGATTSTINKRRARCVICADEGHETADCESVKILLMQNRQQNSQNREICQICDMQGHSAKTCRKITINQQSTFPNNNYNFSNKSYEHRDKNRNEFLRTNHQNGHLFTNNSNDNYRGNFNSQSIKCDYCKFTGQKLEDYRKLKSLTAQIKCTYCNKNGHNIDNCHEIKLLQSKFDKLCKICKNTNHTTEECTSRRVFNQKSSENYQILLERSGLEGLIKNHSKTAQILK